eukprot:TRINITY_DN60783_c0_g1_i1.p1 TRINITY_DN60783_c0_g1~~TRINITY_DN60783_c0_g1_i1.p1  ORF type:complete len:238 (-),score=77.07 TRINITY_DN60783_c0_g1_i1:33-746(-)
MCIRDRYGRVVLGGMETVTTEDLAPEMWRRWALLQAEMEKSGTPESVRDMAHDVVRAAGDKLFRVQDQADEDRFNLREETADLADENTELKEQKMAMELDAAELKARYETALQEAHGEISRLKEIGSQEEQNLRERFSKGRANTLRNVHARFAASEARKALTSWRYAWMRANLEAARHGTEAFTSRQRRLSGAACGGRRGWTVLILSLIHISEPTRLLSISYAVFCLKKKTGVLFLA